VFFANPKEMPATIDVDGLPIQGRLYKDGEIYYSTYDQMTGTFQTHRFEHKESAYCGLVRIVQEAGSPTEKVVSEVNSPRMIFFKYHLFSTLSSNGASLVTLSLETSLRRDTGRRESTHSCGPPSQCLSLGVGWCPTFSSTLTATPPV